MTAYILKRGLANVLELIAKQSHRQGGSIVEALMAKRIAIGASIGSLQAVLLQGLLLLSVFVPQSAMALASTEPVSLDSITQGSLIFESAQGQLAIALPMKTDVSMHISGWVNRVSVRHEFKNTSTEWVNGQYLFPLPNEAAVDQLKLHIGDRVIEGQIQPKAKAKSIYEQAKADGKKASLLEQKRANIFSAQVANLAPNEVLIVELTYQETLDYKDGLFSLRFPMAIAPRYTPKQSGHGNKQRDELHHQVAALKWTNAKEQAGQEQTNTEQTIAHNLVSITVKFDAAMAIENIASPYHSINVDMVEDAAVQVSLDKDAVANRDFVLTWQPVQGAEPTAAVFSQRGKTHQAMAGKSNAMTYSENPASSERKASAEEDYALVMLMPPQVSASEILITPRELILVIDTSGSMSGDAIVQAKKALKLALTGLRPQDCFNILQFDSTVAKWSQRAMPATATNIGRAQHYINGLDANGGTEMSLALDAAFTTLAHKKSRYEGSEANGRAPLRQVLFITDGAVANETILFQQIQDQLGESRLFTIGIGSAPNSHFMQRAAELGRGTYTYIGKLDEVSDKIVSLLEKIEKPHVTDVDLTFSDGTVPDYWPVRIPDLYAHEPILVAVRIPSSVSNDLLIQGQLAGQFWQRRLQLDREERAEGSGQAKGLDLVWARKQIAALELSKQSVNKDRIEKQITAIAMKFHIMSAYTSLVAIDVTPVKPGNIDAKEAKVMQHLPSGWQKSMRAFNQTLPQTGTNSYVFMVFGGMLILLAILYGLSFRQTWLTTKSAG
ncbi:marine proteobacterial sortase target protein [Shewanella sp. 125m-7]